MTRAPGEDALRAAIARCVFMRRTWLRLTQNEVGEKAGISRNQVSAIERSARVLNLAHLVLIADALDVTLDWIAHGPDNQLTISAPEGNNRCDPGEDVRKGRANLRRWSDGKLDHHGARYRI